MIRIIVTGSRKYNDYVYVANILDAEIAGRKVEIVVGDADGVDYHTRRYCNERGIKCSVFDADWDAFGLAAGPIRNNDMGKYAKGCRAGCECVAFPAKDSKGTRDMIYQCKRLRIPCKIYEI